MRVALSWLQSFFQEKLHLKEVVEAYTRLGIEVDGVEERGSSCVGVVVAKVEKVVAHPHADRLCLATVWNGKERVSVICGAPNCREGMTTAFAPVGAELNCGGEKITLEKSKIRGELSWGMLCSEKELGVSEESEGIIELSDSLLPGSSVGELFSNPILELSLTPNLGHCLSVWGLARELLGQLPLTLCNPKEEESFSEEEGRWRAEIEEKSESPLYILREIEKVKVDSSPLWLIKRLEECGMRSINNVVDVTNYVMLELGTPLHAFDREKICGDQLSVRRGRETDAPLILLNGEERQPTKEQLCICDEKGVIAFAGVMGGKRTGVSLQTNSLILEAACFAPRLIRRSSRSLQLSTHSSKRFERGIDSERVEKALDRATALLMECANGRGVKEKVIYRATDSFPKRKVILRPSRVPAVLGLFLSEEEILERLLRLQCRGKRVEEDQLSFCIPSHRHDLTQECDLLDELMRTLRLEELPQKKLSFSLSSETHYLQATQKISERVRTLLLQLQLQEVLCCDLIASREAKRVEAEPFSPVTLSNPSSEEYDVLRPSLLPGILHLVKRNQNRHGKIPLRGFELGKVYRYSSSHQPTEEERVAIFLSGELQTAHWSYEERKSMDFFDLKGLVETLLCKLHLPFYQREEDQRSPLFSAEEQLSFSPSKRGKSSFMGALDTQLLREFGIKSSLYYVEFPLSVLSLRAEKIVPFTSFDQPGIFLDWTHSLPEKTRVGTCLDLLNTLSSPLLQRVELKSIYRAENSDSPCKQVTFRLFYRHAERTLLMEETEREHARILSKAEKKFAFLLKKETT